MRSSKGPQVLENWLAYSGKEYESLHISEYPLYSDARVTGEETVKYKPYAFLNPVPAEEYLGFFQPAIYVRLEYCLEFKVPAMSETDTDAFHGGTLIDEIAALVSLALGIRIRAGTCSREFFDKGDPRGRPVGWQRQPDFLNTRYQRLVVPCAIGRPPLESLSPLLRIRSMNSDEANALTKVARSFQKALLVAEEDPALSWLFLVTSIEKAAGHWKTAGISKAVILKELKPKLYERLGKFDKRDDIRLIIAEELFNQLRSQYKFIEFMLKYLPEPPAKRPPLHGQIRWNKDALRESFATIYGHRSKALHEGTPFPQPMCDQPFGEREGDKIWYEQPGALGYSCSGGAWSKNAIPMYLNTFTYIARGALLNWWSGLGNEPEEIEAPKKPNEQ